MEGLNQIQIHDAGECGVAADPDDSDGGLTAAQVLDRLEHHPQGERFPTACAQVMVFAQQQTRLGVADPLSRLAGWIFCI